uniref:Hpt domain-containing protein n=1 Tax=Chamaesiphon sp. GL140_3_metabinner_50 TaxID=2970812 RepID=UPI0025D4AE03
MENDRILGYFLEEASEHLITIEQGLRKLPETVRQPTMIRELFRAAHSIKGSAAMLGLTDVQKISNQFEANFRILKEHPQIPVDSQLQSLFLQSFGFLSAGIQEVRAASNPYQPDPALGDPIGDPVFEELKAYLQQLLATADAPAVVSTERNLPRDPAIEQVFGEYVSRKLDEVIGLCLQPDRPEIRTQIQQICQKLGNLGENFEFLEWTNLFTACRLAIANPDNSLAQLGESMSIAVKQAQVLVLADRHQAIGITPDLEAFIARHRSDRAASIATSTWQLDDAGGTSKSTGTAQDTTQKLPDLISINTGKVAALTSGIAALGIGSSDRLTEAMAMPAAEFDPEAMELNEFMNLLGNDLPTEGTWMQDDDFLDRDIPLMDLSGDDTDKFYAQISEPFTPAEVAGSANLLQTGSDPLADLATYDEETFYDPNLGNIDEGDLPSFLLNPELAATPSQNSYADLNLPGNIDRQLQPDLASALDLGDIPAPDFSLDHPMSDLFVTAPAPENWSELANLASISDDGLSLNAFDLDPSIATENSTPELPGQPDPLLAITAKVDPPVSDALYLESLNIDELSEASDLLVLEDLTDCDLPESLVEKERINNELNDWIDNSIAEQQLENLTLDLDFFDGDSAVNISNDDRIDFELASLNVPDLEFAESGVTDLDNLDIFDRELQPLPIGNDSANLLDFELPVDAAMFGELSDLNFSEELSGDSTDRAFGLGIASSLAEPLSMTIDNESDLDEDIFDAFDDLYTSEELSTNLIVNDELGLGIAGIANEADLDEDIFDAFNDLDLSPISTNLIANNDGLDLGIAETAHEAELDEDIFDAFNDLDLSSTDLNVNDGLDLGMAGIPDSSNEDAEIDETIFDEFGDLDFNEPSLDLIANGNAIDGDIANSLGDRVEIAETIFDADDNLDFGRVSQSVSNDLKLNSFNSDRPLIDLTSNENLIDLIDSSAIDRSGSDSIMDDFADLDFSANNDLINFDLDLQSFDNLEIDSSIDSSSLNLDLDFLNSSEPSADSIFDDNALVPTDLNSAPDR